MLKITPFTFRLRLYRGILQDNYKVDGVGRMFTADDLEKLKASMPEGIDIWIRFRVNSSSFEFTHLDEYIIVHRNLTGW